jgi:tRNA(fMet)-specific endonuclease VapC
MLHMLDTNMASYVIRGRSQDIREKLAALVPSTVCISVLTRAELLYGLKKLPSEHRLQVAVRRFLKIIRVLPWESDAADFYAEIRYQIVTTGQPIGEMDMMIAAHSMAVGAVLVTNNVKHYERIPGLVLINWT